MYFLPCQYKAAFSSVIICTCGKLPTLTCAHLSFLFPLLISDLIMHWLTSIRRNLIQRVHRWFGKKWISVDWKQFIAEDTPKQSNSFDCGIFLLKVSNSCLTINNYNIPY